MNIGNLLVAVLALATLESLAAVPETVAKITKVGTDPSHPRIAQIEYTNTGTQAITAIAIEQADNPGHLVFSDFPGDPVRPGQSRTINGFSSYNGPVEVAAVVFDDGTSIGNATDAFNGEDVVTEIRNGRHARALEWEKWKAFLNDYRDKDPKTAVAAFLSAAKAIRIGPNRNTTDDGHILVQQVIQNLAGEADTQLKNGTRNETWIRSYLSGFLNERAAAARAYDNMKQEVAK